MSATIIDGKVFAQAIREEVARDTQAFVEQTGIRPGLAVVLVGEDPASQVYVRNKGQQAKAVGFLSEEHTLPANTSQQTLMATVQMLNEAEDIHGILVQLPLPSHLDSNAVLNAILPEKDVDGFHPINVGRLWTGNPVSVPCTPLGCSLILKQYIGDLSGKNAVVIGRSNIVGKPMAALLLSANATVTLAHSRTNNLKQLVQTADIVVAAVGRAKMIQGDWIKPGAVVLDVGINRVMNGAKAQLQGDVDFDGAIKNAAAITPVPGGIGPVTIACLLKNTLSCAKFLRNNKAVK